MASIVWMSVFCLLCVELVITFILVVPVPASVRRAIVRAIRRINVGPTVKFAVKWIMLMLVGAVIESVTTLQRLTKREQEPVNQHPSSAGMDARSGYVEMSFEKQRKFRAERNLYLSGFALTLLLVIARIVQLMQDGVTAEEERDHVTKRLDDVASTAAAAGTPIRSENDTPAGLRQRTKAQ